MSLEPQDASGARRIDPDLLPPDGFIATAMHFAMVAATERDRELIADLAPQCRCLRKAKVMSISGTATANQARLLGNGFDVLPVANTPRRRQSEHGFINN